MVLDSQTGRPIAGALIAIEANPSRSASASADGRFQLSLPPGKYVLLAGAENYLPARLDHVEVSPGQVTEVNILLVLKTVVTQVEVVEKLEPLAATTEAMLAERKLTSVVSDALSAEELRSSTASDAAEAVQKITGVSVVGSGYVYVRGLGERYSATVLNRALIPTTEPDKRVVPLDLLPVSLIDNVRILKSYSPDMPGEFSGGLVELRTMDFPLQRTFRVSFSSGFNTRTTFRPFLTYAGGNRDFFGFDDGTRALPAMIPAERRLFPGAFAPQQLQAFGQAFANRWEPVPVPSARPPQRYSMAGGGSFGRLGVVGAIASSNQPVYQQELQRYLRQEGAGAVVFTNYEDFRTYTESARLGGVFNLAYRLNASTKLALRNTFTHD
ncbi:MAG: carboxypeptidase regulatory-like domain-containing protein, partial [Bryobacteraceae bacterium]